MRVTDSLRLQVLHTVDYRRALNNPSNADERRKGRDLSRAMSRDIPIARDLASNLLETAERLSVGQGTGPAATGIAAAPADSPPATVALPARGAPAP
jgi:hypothetical protein